MKALLTALSALILCACSSGGLRALGAFADGATGGTGATPGRTVTARLVASRYGYSIAGQPIMVCTYDYYGSRFERNVPSGQSCPYTVEAQ